MFWTLLVWNHEICDFGGVHIKSQNYIGMFHLFHHLHPRIHLKALTVHDCSATPRVGHWPCRKVASLSCIEATDNIQQGQSLGCLWKLQAKISHDCFHLFHILDVSNQSHSRFELRPSLQTIPGLSKLCWQLPIACHEVTQNLTCSTAPEGEIWRTVTCQTKRFASHQHMVS